MDQPGQTSDAHPKAVALEAAGDQDLSAFARAAQKAPLGDVRLRLSLRLGLGLGLRLRMRMRMRTRMRL